jgi:hypothetical protein
VLVHFILVMLYIHYSDEFNSKNTLSAQFSNP